jgi:TRAP-type C4-dicarboxylate transport system permease small subunit
MEKSKKGKLGKILGNLDISLACVVLSGLIVLTFAGVLKRYIFRDPIAWMEELQPLLFLWAVMLAAGAAFRTGGHVVIELLILAYLTWQSCVFYGQCVVTNKVTLFLQIPYSLAYVILPIGCVLMIISVIYKELTDFRAARKGESNDVKEGIEE